jgi:ATP/maltotriose-dependent transcriptional regulator MalT
MLPGPQSVPEKTPAPALRAYTSGIESLVNAHWVDACAAFNEAATLQPNLAEAWAGLAAAAYWVPDEELILEARERAYHLYRERGDRLNAALMAGWLAVDAAELTGQTAIANGWIQRASRLIAKHRETPQAVWVSLMHARLLMVIGAEAGTVKRMATRAAALARRHALPDAEALSLALEGNARLNVGDLRHATECLDEAATVVLSGECGDLTAAGLTLCLLMGACERTRDFDRARQWCAAARQFSEDRGFPVILSICRPHYAAVLMWRGHWPEAEEHLQIGSRELMEFMPPFAVGALALLAGLRWRQGRWNEAEEIFDQIKHEPGAQLGLAELIADMGDLGAAIDILERHLRTIPATDKLERGSTLEILVRCLAVNGQNQQASGHLEELREIAQSTHSQSLRAGAAFAEGIVASASADWERAQQCLGDAVELFERAGSPFDSARARICLAETLFDPRQPDAAVREAHIAAETFLRIGAAKEAERASHLLAKINAERTTSPCEGSDGLTTRESEILTLLAQGQSNQDIAGGLVLSVRTVERHISNIYQKLGLDGRTARTAAAAYAHRSAQQPNRN